MKTQHYDFGMIGLGTMGRNLVLNMADHGFSVVGYDKDAAKVQALESEAGRWDVHGAGTLQEFIECLKTPRAILLLVPAGPIVDAVVSELLPFLAEHDLVADCGNSHFTDTNRRTEQLAAQKLHFMGIGVSGGESGARRGPSIMPGGSKDAYARMAPMLEAVSAKVNGEPCVTWLGPGAAGHYVKMVHNGIEYALMQLISESYHLLKEAGGLSNEELHTVFAIWNRGALQSFLIEITAEIFRQKDDLTPNGLIDMIKGSAKQKGTGMWTSQDAMALHSPIPSIDMAVAQRDLSALSDERASASMLYGAQPVDRHPDKTDFIRQVEEALHFTSIVTYAQGLALLSHASMKYGFGLNISDVARIWRGGCIIRAALLEDIRGAYGEQNDLPNLLLDKRFSGLLSTLVQSTRSLARMAVGNGIPAPVLLSGLSYFDTYRRSWLPANLIQAQRDFFGAHTYERIDRDGVFHTHWED